MLATLGYVSESGEDTVKTHISRLRNRLKDVDDFQIITIKGLGYKAELVKEKERRKGNIPNTGKYGCCGWRWKGW